MNGRLLCPSALEAVGPKQITTSPWNVQQAGRWTLDRTDL